MAYFLLSTPVCVHSKSLHSSPLGALVVLPAYSGDHNARIFGAIIEPGLLADAIFDRSVYKEVGIALRYESFNEIITTRSNVGSEMPLVHRAVRLRGANEGRSRCCRRTEASLVSWTSCCLLTRSVRYRTLSPQPVFALRSFDLGLCDASPARALSLAIRLLPSVRRQFC